MTTAGWWFHLFHSKTWVEREANDLRFAWAMDFSGFKESEDIYSLDSTQQSMGILGLPDHDFSRNHPQAIRLEGRTLQLSRKTAAPQRGQFSASSSPENKKEAPEGTCLISNIAKLGRFHLQICSSEFQKSPTCGLAGESTSILFVYLATNPNLVRNSQLPRLMTRRVSKFEPVSTFIHQHGDSTIIHGYFSTTHGNFFYHDFTKLSLRKS